MSSQSGSRAGSQLNRLLFVSTSKLKCKRYVKLKTVRLHTQLVARLPSMYSAHASSQRSVHPKDCICKCRSHCTIYNPSTGVYEGEGNQLSHSTRDQHSRDDQRLERASLNTGVGAQHVSAPGQQILNGIQLIRDELNLCCQLPVSSPMTPFVFANDPLTHGDYIFPSEADIIRPNSGVHALRPDSFANGAFLEMELPFCELLARLTRMESTEEINMLTDHLLDEVWHMHREKELQWVQQRSSLVNDKVVVNTGWKFHIWRPIYCLTIATSPEIYFYEYGPKNPVLKAALLVSFALEYIYFTPRRAVRVHLGGLKDILKSTGTHPSLIWEIPKDPHTASSQFRLEGVTHQYISCSSCHSLYPLKLGDSPVNIDQLALPHCPFKKTLSSSLCNTPLWMQHKVGPDLIHFKPCKKYLHQDLKVWLGHLLSRKGIEEILDWPLRTPPPDPDSPIDDIWLSPVFRNLKDSSGQPFLSAPVGEGRLVFSFAMDSFDPFGMKIAKQSASSTRMWLVCLNFPEHMRYLQENVFLASVIQGPDKPSNEQMNHYIQLIVNDLLDFWDPGVFFSRTYQYQLGRLFKAMLVSVVADMLALRQIIGSPGSTTAHYFCTFCDLDYDDIEVFDQSEWSAKDADHICYFARLWKDAACERHQEDIFKACGVRWSALFGLPYWQPIIYSIIESMHVLDWNLSQQHIRNNFQINLSAKGGDGTAITPRPEKRKHVSSKIDQASYLLV